MERFSTLGEVLEYKKELYEISDKDRIRYQLNKQNLGMSDLLQQRNKDGSDREAHEISEYIKSNEYDGAIEKYRRYLSGKLPKKAYNELCVMLRIEPTIGALELEEIAWWKKKIEDNGINYQKRISKKEKEKAQKNENELQKDHTRYSKKIVEERQKLAKKVTEVVPKIASNEEEYLYEKELLAEELAKKEFIEYSKAIPIEVELFWKSYPHFFDINYDSDLIFFARYIGLNDNGKKIVSEMIEEHLEGDELNFRDKQIEIYENISMIELATLKCDDKSFGDLWEEYFYNFNIEELDARKELTLDVMKCGKKDWEALINYHRVQTLGKAINADDYLQFFDRELDLVMKIPFCNN